jgi:heparosan-N-sulfate-glucuronate 5-epimerase
MKSHRRRPRFSLGSMFGFAIGAVAAAYGIRIWKQLGVLKASLRRQRVFDDDFHSQRLGRYYYSFFPSYMQPETEPPEVDENGIPVSDYSRKLLIRGVTGRHYNPLTVAHWAAGAYDDYLATGDDRHYDLFIKRTDWLVENQQTIGDGASLWYHTARVGKDKALWTSAMAQGYALSSLCRAYQETGDEKYLETARRAVKSFDISVDEGGLTAIDEAGNAFYEEWPLGATHILNGHIFSLFGLHDYYRITRDDHAFELFEAGVAAVRNRLPDYDVGFWSRYSLAKRRSFFNHWTIAAPIYQQVHIDQLRFLYKITGDEILARYADRWEAQQRRPVSALINIAYIVFKDVVWVKKHVQALVDGLRAQ